MARPIKSGLEFPKWKPMNRSMDNMNNCDFSVRYQAARNSSSSFIRRNDVRNYIFSRDGHKCTKCSSTEYLQVDHVVSVYQYVVDRLDFEGLNKLSNLTTLCRKCNASKLP